MALTISFPGVFTDRVDLCNTIETGCSSCLFYTKAYVAKALDASVPAPEAVNNRSPVHEHGPKGPSRRRR
jgi:hypothetical protein